MNTAWNEFLGAALLACALPALALGPAAEPDDDARPPVDFPYGGWNYSGFIDKSDDTAVAYPYNLIDRGTQEGRTLIQGRLAAHLRAQTQGEGANRQQLKQTNPPKLVVNGNPMPLYSDNEGRFARPYAFGPGSNSIEIKNPEGESLQRLQFYEANPHRARAQIRAILSWDDDQAEVDLHVISPNGEHVTWFNPWLSSGGGMDVDSVDGAGPEIFSVTGAMRGPYQFYVNYWGNYGAWGYHFEETRQKPIITCRLSLI
ncbi:MAG: DUF2135 domain-containing protein, partial [Azoarcus sp.]|nr:DUF2135 domain-containing protein [Azoarcus sp.]